MLNIFSAFPGFRWRFLTSQTLELHQTTLTKLLILPCKAVRVYDYGDLMASFRCKLILYFFNRKKVGDSVGQTASSCQSCSAIMRQQF